MPKNAIHAVPRVLPLLYWLPPLPPPPFAGHRTLPPPANPLPPAGHPIPRLSLNPAVVSRPFGAARRWAGPSENTLSDTRLICILYARARRAVLSGVLAICKWASGNRHRHRLSECLWAPLLANCSAQLPVSRGLGRAPREISVIVSVFLAVKAPSYGPCHIWACIRYHGAERRHGKSDTAKNRGSPARGVSDTAPFATCKGPSTRAPLIP